VHLIPGAVLGAALWTFGVEASNCQWYKVPAGSTVTFTLTELWGVLNGLPSDSFVEGDATKTVEDLDRRTEQIAFQDSALAVSGVLTGEKIPPVTPNIIDVRVDRQDVTADFPRQL
jgi:hypothetical protein